MEKDLKILIVARARVSRSMIRSTLAAHHHAEHVQVAAVSSAGEALHCLANEKFDIITCALQLPDMDGIHLCRTIRTQPIYRFTPFIALTAEPHERHMKKGFRAR